MSNISFAGEVVIESVIVRSIASKTIMNINSQVIGINIYEDIFSPFITGSISINDSVDLMNAIPLNGEEIVTIGIRTPGLDYTINLEFYIYRCTDREYVGDRSVIYSLHIISKEAIVDINKRLSMSFKGTYDDIIQRLVRTDVGLKTDKALLYEKSNGQIKFVSNYWTPVEAIGFLCGKIENNKKTPSYIFFENRDGFNFTSLDFMYANQPIIQDFTYNNFSKEVTANSTYRNVELDYKRIISISIPKSFDYMEDVTSGKYGSKMFSYDLLTKQYSLKTYNYLEEFVKANHLNKYPSASSQLISRTNSFVSSKLTHFGIHNGFGKSTTDTSNDQDRQSLLLQAKSQAVNIVVPGRFDYTVGKRVSLKLYKNEVITTEATEDDMIDKINSGNYIISAINHTVYRDRHECHIELIKDSFLFRLEEGN